MATGGQSLETGLGRGAATDASVRPLFMAVATVVFDEYAGFSHAQHQFTMRHSSLKEPLKLSTYPFCQGCQIQCQAS